jgi:exopolysaccharide production protein ExoY
MLTASNTGHLLRYKTARYALGGPLKRGVDIVVSILALVAFTPLIILTICLIHARSAGPAFFIHKRVGQNGREFGCVKFRTMHVGSERRLSALLQADPEAAREFAATAKLRNDPRVIAGIGALLRKSSFDEVPQFWNVLKGEMSLVGPRPVTREELDRYYGPHAAEVLRARPGISGLWQVSGRSGLSYEDRVRLDLDYVRDWRLMRDLSILARTVVVVVYGTGAF